MVFFAVSLKPELPPPLRPPDKESESTAVDVGMTVSDVLVPTRVCPSVTVVKVVKIWDVTLVGTFVDSADDSEVDSSSDVVDSASVVVEEGMDVVETDGVAEGVVLTDGVVDDGV